jgi:hypothetical protein
MRTIAGQTQFGGKCFNLHAPIKIKCVLQLVKFYFGGKQAGIVGFVTFPSFKVRHPR